jgi:hypothetical protein
MATFNKFNDFAEQIGKAIHDFSTHTIKVMLTNTAPTSTNAVKADLTEISAGNGYTAGGTAASATWSETSGTAKLVLADTTFTASGGSIGPFRYAVIYNDTSASDNLIGYYDYGSSISLASGESLTVDFDATNGVLQIA